MKKHLFLLSGLASGVAALGLALFVVFSVLANPTPSQLQAIVQVLITDASTTQWYESGSGVVIDDFPHILTNYHVVKTAVENSQYKILVCFTDSDKTQPICIANARLMRAEDSGESSSYEEMFDLALLEIPTINEDGKDINFSEFLSKHDIVPPSIHFDRKNFVSPLVEVGDTVSILGYPAAGGSTITYTEGIVSGFETYTLEDGTVLPIFIKTDAKINPGNSGGGAFDADNNFIGIPEAVAGGDGNIGYIISLPVVNLFLSTVHIQFCDSNEGGNCVCQYGYYPDSTNTYCVKDLSIPDSELKIQYRPWQPGSCSENSSLDIPSNICYCNPGFHPNADQTACVSDQTQEVVVTSTQQGREEVLRGSAEEQRENVRGSFQDVNDATPYKVAIDFLRSRNIIGGYSDGTFRPGNLLNRAELLKILIAAKFSTIGTDFNQDCFGDVKKDQWFTTYVCFAKSKNIVGGGPGGRFNPGDNVNYAEALKMVLGTYDLAPSTTTDPWYKAYIDQANLYAINLIGVKPDQYITRGEAAELMYLTIKLYEKGPTS